MIAKLAKLPVGVATLSFMHALLTVIIYLIMKLAATANLLVSRLKPLQVNKNYVQLETPTVQSLY